MKPAVREIFRGASSRADEHYDVLGRSSLVAIFARAMLALHAVGVNLLLVRPRVDSAGIVVGVSLFMLVWTGLVSAVVLKTSRRRAWVFVADTVVVAAVVLITPIITEPGEATITLAGYWLCTPGLFAAMFRSTLAGLISAGIVSIGLFIFPSHMDFQRLGIAFVSVLLAGCAGLMIEQLRVTVMEQERERLKAASLAERERLSRIVHDGALQVLALVEREGPALGPVGARLAALASDSESQLRRHLQDREVPEPDHSTTTDLAGALDKYQSGRVNVATMAGELQAPRQVVEEVELALQEILNNVWAHAGERARVWVLLDQEFDDEAIIWVRDDGVGMEPEQATAAAERGRFGIRDSIVGRITAIDGSAILKSSPGAGTEWELRIPLGTD